jgi:hypothetical protein
MHSARERKGRTSREAVGRVPQGGNAIGGPNVYTDPSLLDVAGALEALPELGLRSRAEGEQPGLAQG